MRLWRLRRRSDPNPDPQVGLICQQITPESHPWRLLLCNSKPSSSSLNSPHMSLVVWFIFRVGHYFSIVTDNDIRFVDDLFPLPPGCWPLWTLNLNLLTGNLFVSFSNTAWLETWEQWSLSWSAKVFPTSSISHKHSEIDSNPDSHYYSRKLVIVKYRKWSIESQTNWTHVFVHCAQSRVCLHSASHSDFILRFTNKVYAIK